MSDDFVIPRKGHAADMFRRLDAERERAKRRRIQAAELPRPDTKDFWLRLAGKTP